MNPVQREPLREGLLYSVESPRSQALVRRCQKGLIFGISSAGVSQRSVLAGRDVGIVSPLWRRPQIASQSTAPETETMFIKMI